MKILVYEHLVATGGGAADDSPEVAAMLTEGAAMWRAVVADFASVPGVQVTTVRASSLAGGVLDHRQVSLGSAETQRVRIADIVDSAVGEEESLTARVCQLATEVNAVVLIAPECDGILERLARAVVAAGGNLISPGPDFIALAADKHRTAAQLSACGVKAPRGLRLDPGAPLPADFSYPAVFKPVDGAGSTGVRLIPAWTNDLANDLADLSESDSSTAWRLEEFRPGIPASVAVLCGPAGPVPLQPCRQRLSDDGRFTYLGGDTRLSAELARRARRLAARALAAFPPTRGYVGIDMVLGEDPAGSDDYVIELNPRHTTSYVGLRAACRGNLAAELLRAAVGEIIQPRFGPEVVEFQADGRVERLA